MKKIICLLVLLAGFTANVFAAESITVTWAAPATRADGSPLAPDEIAGFEVYRCESGDPFVTIASDKNSYTDPVTPEQVSYCYQLATVDTNGMRSQLSNPVSVALTPPAAVNITITVNSSFTVTGN